MWCKQYINVSDDVELSNSSGTFHGIFLYTVLFVSLVILLFPLLSCGTLSNVRCTLSVLWFTLWAIFSDFVIYTVILPWFYKFVWYFQSTIVLSIFFMHGSPYEIFHKCGPHSGLPKLYQTCTRIHIHIHMHTSSQPYAYTHILICMAYICAHTHTTHTHTHTHNTHTHNTHTHLHTHIVDIHIQYIINTLY